MSVFGRRTDFPTRTGFPTPRLGGVALDETILMCGAKLILREV